MRSSSSLDSSAGAGSRSAVRLINTAIFLVAVTVAGLLVRLFPAQAFETSGGGELWHLKTGNIYYKRAANFPSAAIDALHHGDQAWAVQFLGSVARPYDGLDPLTGTSEPVVQYQYIDGDSGMNTLAQTNVAGCYRYDNVHWVTCTLTFDSGNTWNFDPTAFPTSSQEDFWGVSTHEFGHWLGLDHSTFAPPYDTAPPSMNATINPGETFSRDISQDDAQGDLAAHSLRDGAPGHNFLANGDLEFTTPFVGMGFRPAGSSPSSAIINDSTQAHSLSHYVEFKGYNSSWYSDLSIPTSSEQPCYGTDVWVRDESDTPASVALAFWDLNEAPTDPNTSLSKSATLQPHVWTKVAIPANGDNVTCWTEEYAVSKGRVNSHIRVELYNNSNGSISLDDFDVYSATDLS